MFELFTEQSIRAIMLAQEEARRMGHNLVGTEQILLGIIREKNNPAAHILADLGVTLDAARTVTEKIIGRGTGVIPVELPFTPRVRSLFEHALQSSREQGYNYVAPEFLLLSLTQVENGMAARVLQELDLDLSQVQALLIEAIGEVAAVPAGRQFESQSERSFPTSPRSQSVLEEFGTDLTTMAAAGKLDPVIGRQLEIERVVQILGRRTKNNPILIGAPGVGKTAIAEGLAQRIVNQDVPESLADKRVVSLDLGLLVAGTRMRGDFEERISAILDEVRATGNVILMIDEVHTLVGAGSVQGGMDAANMLKPALARGELQCIAATTLDEYRQYIEKDAALERRFQPVRVGEPSVEDAIAILYGLRDRYEQHHKVRIEDAALEAAVTLAARYIPDRQLPDKAIDLIDEAGSRVRFANPGNLAAKALKRELRQVTITKDEAVHAQDFVAAAQWRDRELELEQQVAQGGAPGNPETQILPTVTPTDIAYIVESWTGIPVNQLTATESVQLLHIEETLHQRVIGQEEAVKSVARALRRSRVGLQGGDRPIASFFFSGPTGVGKTELAKALAASFFGSEELMIRLDMSEFMESQSTSKLIGSPPGYVGYGEGGQLTEAVRRKPHSVILFDEVEKAHPDVFNMLLQLLDDGRLTDSQGRKVDFTNTVIIMTSNLGSRVIEKGGAGLGFGLADAAADAQYQRIQSLVNDELKQFFRPEFLNRLDEIIVFRQLTQPEVAQIATLMVQDVASRLTEQGIVLEVSDRLKDRLATEGYSPAYGARSLRRVVTRLLEDALAEAILAGQIRAGETAIADLDSTGQVVIQSIHTKQLAWVS
jgi:ATP-dependent Clp protease ATP-binding subunit ClpC